MAFVHHNAKPKPRYNPPSAAPLSSEDGPHLNAASYKILSKYFDEISRYPSDAEVDQLVDQLRTQTGCHWVNSKRVRRYFRGKRTKADWPRSEGPGIKQVVTGVAGTEGVFVAAKAMEADKTGPAEQASDAENVDVVLEEETERRRVRTTSATLLDTISNTVGRTTSLSKLLCSCPPTPSAVRAVFDSPHSEETPSVSNPFPIWLVDSARQVEFDPGSSFTLRTPTYARDQGSCGDEDDMDIAPKLQDMIGRTRRVFLLPSDPRTNELATLLAGALEGATGSIAAPGPPKTFKDLGRFFEQQTASRELLAGIRTGAYSQLGFVSSDARPRD
ncbi:hypothetical protein OH76DRAFT_1474507 [Lentinus brumalis]|uniref:Uncharacterized protein n=1 Tax=Lentinus brumalis TaxID=2498619 RepID=A0A371CV99_9APHY|nr:hypothetical protein OH76DRAFT_1474507 [Polyporus brumalis]